MIGSFRPHEVGTVPFSRSLEKLLGGHKKVAMYFSAGRDSIALYHVLRPYLDRITVVWMNSGNVFPEIREYAEKIRQQTPDFVEIVGNQPQSVKEHGYPVDVLPIDYTSLGASCTYDKPIKLRSYLDCCYENISLPLYNYIKENEFTLVFRGNRASESHKTPGGTVQQYENTLFVNLIDEWSDEEVVEYLKACGEEITPRLRIGHSSLDCQNCTAYTLHSKERIKYIKQYHPRVFAEIKPVFLAIDKAVREEMSEIANIVSEP